MLMNVQKCLVTSTELTSNSLFLYFYFLLYGNRQYRTLDY
jgi:hypothetical protein